jgi:hypothetical protein
MATFDKLKDLSIKIGSYELEDRDRSYGDFTRPSTVIHLRGGGEEGLGEDVVYDVLDHMAHRDAGPVNDFSAPSTLGEFCELIGQTDLFAGSPPEREPSRHYRRWAYESAGLDLALRQNGTTLHEALGRDPKPLTFVCSTRLSSFPAEGEEKPPSNIEPVTKRLAKYPGTRFKLDPENDWTDELIAELKEAAGVDVLDLKGHYKGTPVDVDTDPELYRRVAEAFPEAWIEDPDLNDETRPVLEPYADRITYDAPLHSLADIKGLDPKPKAINSKPSRFGSLEEILAIYDYCDAEGIAVYSGGQGEVGPGRGQAQYLSALFHPDSSNDIAPSGYNDPSVPDGLATSPMDPVPSATGFRWAE